MGDSAQTTVSRPEARAKTPTRVVMHTFGSYGDLHPYMALGLEMQARGHHVTLATSEIYREKITAEGLSFHPVRPDVSRFLEDKTFFARTVDPKTGPEFLFRDVIAPATADILTDLREAVRGADLFVSHPLTFVGGILAAQSGVPWVSTILSPASLFSAHDPPIFAPAPLLSQVARLHPVIGGAVLNHGRRVSASWAEPITRLYRQEGVALHGNPFFDAQHAPQLVLALFSNLMAKPQPDWPSQVRVTGFCFYDRHDQNSLDPELAAFLKAGGPPIVCTLGSAVVNVAGDFYYESAYLGRRTGRRVVLLTGRDPVRLPDPLPAGVAAFPYAPFSEIFPRACAIVHQGGVGTTGQALLAGKPQLIMPVAHDQHDNAARVKRLGIAHVISRRWYTRSRAAGLLLRLWMDKSTAQQAAEIGRHVAEEDGTRHACDLLEKAVGVRQ